MALRSTNRKRGANPPGGIDVCLFLRRVRAPRLPTRPSERCPDILCEAREPARCRRGRFSRVDAREPARLAGSAQVLCQHFRAQHESDPLLRPFVARLPELLRGASKAPGGTLEPFRLDDEELLALVGEGAPATASASGDLRASALRVKASEYLCLRAHEEALDSIASGAERPADTAEGLLSARLRGPLAAALDAARNRMASAGAEGSGGVRPSSAVLGDVGSPVASPTARSRRQGSLRQHLTNRGSSFCLSRI